MKLNSMKLMQQFLFWVIIIISLICLPNKAHCSYGAFGSMAPDLLNELFENSVAADVMQEPLELKANDDFAKTNPVKPVKVNVVGNDILTCENYTIAIVTQPNATQGIAAIDGDVITFTPAIGYFGTVTIPYKLTCNSVDVTANLIIEVAEFSTPINVVPQDAKCIEDMTQGVAFAPALKYIGGKINNRVYNLDGFSMPIVGDLNGDGKPEVVAMGMNNGGSLSGTGDCIIVFDGQTGAELYRYMLTKLGSEPSFNLRTGPRHNSPGKLAMADVDGDGIVEIIIVETGTKGKVYCLKPVYDAGNKNIINPGFTKIWEGSNFKAPIILADYNVFGSPIPYIADLNGDGIPEVIVYNKIYNGQTGALVCTLEKLEDFKFTTKAAENLTIKNNYAYVGRRPGAAWQDDHIPRFMVADIDGDGVLDIIAGSKVYLMKDGEALGTVALKRIIYGPSSITTQRGTNPNNKETLQVNDGFTVVADIDGDGRLEVIVLAPAENLLNISTENLLYVWDPMAADPTTPKAATFVFSDSFTGTMSFPFIGDINGRLDDYSGTKRLPEICFNGGVLHTNDSKSSLISFHPQSSSELTANSSSFNKSSSGLDSRSRGHIIGFTYHASADESTPMHQRLKLSWAMEHNDESSCTGITMFDFDNDGVMELCYRDETHIRVISPGRKTFINRKEEPSANGPIRFKADALSYTGFEAPVIADVNRDGSADILSLSRDKGTNASYGNLYVYEHKGGTDKWAPCPAVWNQTLYNPLHINEDMTVPAKPQSMLTEYLDRNDNTIQPFNGVWTQQPIIKEGQKYLPVIRQPDVVVLDVKVTATVASSTVVLTVRNDGTASINATTPVMFYLDEIAGSKNIGSSKEIGVDIFPNEKVQLTYTLTGDYREKLIWVRITDDGTNFPAKGYQDCELSNNAIAGIDCPGMNISITASPSNTICGNNAAVMLETSYTAKYAVEASFQWYKNEKLISGATKPIYFAKEAGDYKVYVVDNLCRKFSNIISLTKGFNSVPQPKLVVNPDSSFICNGLAAKVYLYIENVDSYTDPTFQWYLDGKKIDGVTAASYLTSKVGIYTVYITDGVCGYLSNEKEIKTSNNTIENPTISASQSTLICGNESSVLLQLNNENKFKSPKTYQWYLNSIPIQNGNALFYAATEPGLYSIQVIDSNGCSAFGYSPTITKEGGTIKKPILSMNPANGEMCGENGSVILEVENKSDYNNNNTYIWTRYVDGKYIWTYLGENYIVNDEGTYILQVVDTSTSSRCAALSDSIRITRSVTDINKPLIITTSGDTNVCGANGVVVLMLDNANQFVNPTYQWYKDVKSNFSSIFTAHPIPGATSYVFKATEEGTYSLRIVEGECIAFSNVIAVTKDNSLIEKPIVSKSPVNGEICGANGSVLLTVANAADYTDATYIWYKNDTIIQKDANSTLKVNAKGNYFVQVIDGACSSISDVENMITSIVEIKKPVILSSSPNNKICEQGGVVILQVTNITDYTAPTYQWYKNDQPIAGANDLLYTVLIAGKYQLQIKDGNCLVFSDMISITTDNTNITKPEVSMTNNGVLCNGGNVLLSINDTAIYTNPSYQWYKGNQMIDGATAFAYLATISDTYFVVVKEGTCVTRSDIKSITDNSTTIVKPLINKTNNGVVCAGGNVLLTINDTTSYTTPTYQWYKNNTIITGATQSSYVSTVQGNYSVEVKSGSCSALSDATGVTESVTTIVKPVVNKTNNGVVCAGGNVLLTINDTTSYTTPTYQWYKNNTIITGATQSSYVTTVQGNYSVEVKSGSCSALSDATGVTESVTTIVKPVVNKTNNGVVCAGGNVLLTINDTTSYTTPTYQWYKNNTIITGATQSSYVSTVQGNYSVEVKSGSCSALSDATGVTESVTTIVKPVVNKTNNGVVCAGGNVLLTINDTTSYTTPTYQWYKNNTIITGATQSSYLTTVQGNYSVEVKSGTCSALSDATGVTESVTTIVKPVVNKTNNGIVCAGGNVLLTINDTTSYTTPTYQWYKNNTIITGATQSSYLTTVKGNYSVEVKSGSCSALSDATGVTESVTTIVKPVVNKTNNGVVCAGGNVLLTINDTTSYTTPTYQWYKNNTIITGATQSSYLTTVKGNYSVEVKSGSCSALSDATGVTESVTTIVKPVVNKTNNGIVCAGGNVLLTINDTTSYTTPTYQWYKNNTIITGATQSSYLTTVKGNYSVEVKSVNCSALSDATGVTESGNSINQPDIVHYPSSLNICDPNGVVLFRLQNSYTGAAYQWYKNNKAITSANEIMYSTTEAGTYFLEITTPNCGVISNTFTVTKNAGSIIKPNISAMPTDADLGQTTPIVLSMLTPVSSYTSPSYQWYKGTELLSGTLSTYNAVMVGNYKLLVTDNNACAAWSNEIDVITTNCNPDIAIPEITYIPSSKNICETNGSVLLQCNNITDYDSPSYEWYKDDVEIIGATAPALEVTALGNYKLRVSDKGCIKYSVPVSITNDGTGNISKPTVTRIPTNGKICGVNGSVMLFFNNASAFSGTFQWYKDNYAIAGTQGMVNYEVAEAGKYRVVVIEGSCMAMSVEEDITKDNTSIFKPSLTKSPNQTEICGVNGSIQLSVSNTADFPGATYYWYKDNQIQTSGNMATYTAKDAGTYYVQVAIGSCLASSGKETVTKNAAFIDKPAITSYPTTNNICANNAVVVLKLTTTYTSPAYQWYKDGVAISGANTLLYSASEAGNYYLHVVDGNCGTVSDIITVTKNGGGTIITPVITSFPAANSEGIALILSGRPVELELENASNYASGTKYYWYLTNAIVGVKEVAETADYTTTDTGSYKLLVVEGQCASWSNEIKVQEDGCNKNLPQIAAVPSDNICVKDGNGSILLQCNNRSDYSSPSYQWFKDAAEISGATKAAYEAKSAGSYTLRIEDQGCVMLSANKTITKEETRIEKPTITRTPLNGEICGTNGSVILTLSNTQVFTNIAEVQWYKDNYAIAGAKDSIYVVTEPGNYRIMVIETVGCSAFSTEETILKNASTIVKPVLSKTPDKTEICKTNGSILLSVSNTGDYSAATYNWYKGNKIVQTGLSASYAAKTAGTYFVQVVSGSCSSVSDNETFIEGTITIDEPNVTYYPSGLNICSTDGVVVFRLQNSYSGATYQWYRNNAPISGANTTMYSATEAGTYYLQVLTADCGSISVAYTVTKDATVITQPEIIATPDDADLGQTTPIVLSMLTPGSSYTSPSYQWYKESELFLGTLNTYNAVTTGNYKMLVVDGNACASWSNTIPVITSVCNPEIATPDVAFIPSSKNICETNGSVLLQCNNITDYNSPSYEWYKDNAKINGATAPALEVSTPGNYKLKVTDKGCIKYSVQVSITNDGTGNISKPAVTRIPTNGNICGVNGSVMLNFNNVSAFSGTFQWYKDNYAIAGTQGMVNYEVAEAGKYRVVVIEGSCMAMSVEEDITKDNTSIFKPSLTKSPNQTEICGVNGSIQLSVSNTADFPGATYYWYKDNQIQTSGNMATYTVKDAGTYYVQVAIGSCLASSDKETLTVGSTSIAKAILDRYPTSHVICGDDGVVVLKLRTTYTNASYQWYKNGIAIAGANRIMYSASDAGNYYLHVLEGNCGTESDVVTITKVAGGIDLPSISTNPADGKIIGSNPVQVILDNAAQFSNEQFYLYKGLEVVSNAMPYSTTTEGAYKLLVVNNNNACASWSNEVQITDAGCTLPVADIRAVPSSLNVCGDTGSVFMSLRNISDYTGTIAYQWYKDGSPVSGAAKSYYAAVDQGAYKLHITDANCAGYTNEITITKSNTVIAKPTVRMTPSTGLICGDTGSVMLILENSNKYPASAEWQWYKNGLPIAGAIKTTYEALDKGDYMLQITDGGCAVISGDFSVTKNSTEIAKPTITASGNKICGLGGNGSVMLLITNTDKFTSPRYQWFMNDLLLGGATSESYEAKVGGNYRLQVVDNNTCAAFSEIITIAADPSSGIAKPVIATLPANDIICTQGGSVLLYLENLTDYTAPTYQWYKDNLPITGATESAYEVTVRADYRIEVKEGACTALSLKKTINRNTNSQIEQPIVSMRPQSKELCGNQGVVVMHLENTFDYTAPTYQWLKNNYPIENATDRMYVVTEAGNYRIFVSDGDCGVLSQQETISKSLTTISRPVVISSSNSNVVCGTNGNIVLTVNNTSQYASGSQYVWYNNNQIVQEGNSYSLKVTTAGNYFVQVIDATCSSISDTTDVTTSTTEITAPTITATNNGVICQNGGNVLLTITNFNSSATYQWYKNNIPLSGQTGMTMLAITEGKYTVYVTESICGALSNELDVTVNTTGSITPPAITATNNGVICQNGGNVLLTITNFDSTMAYQWYKNNLPIIGQTGMTMLVTTDGRYTVYVVDGVCGALSNAEVVTVNITGSIIVPTITATNNGVICQNGGSVILTISNFDANAAYQWYKNNRPLSGEKDIILFAQGIGTYSVYATENGCGSLSNEINVTQNSAGAAIAPIITATNDGHICQSGGSVILTITNYNANASYQWYKNNQPIIGQTGQALVANTEGKYTVYVTENNCGVLSDIQVVLVNIISSGIAPLISVTNNGIVCQQSGSVMLSITNPRVNTTYQWYKNNLEIPGANSTVYLTTEAGNYTVYATENGCGILSNIQPVVVNTNGIATVPLIAADNKGVICNGKAVNIALTNSIEFVGIAAYQWYKDGLPIEGANSSNYTASEVGSYTAYVTNNGCGALSNTVKIITGVIPSITVTSIGICTGRIIDITTAVSDIPTNTILMYYTDMAGTVPVQSPNTVTLTSASTTFYVKAIDTIHNCETSLLPIIAYVYKTTSIKSLIIPQSICQGDDLALTATAEGYNLTYEWYHNGEMIHSTSNPTYIRSSVNEAASGKYYLKVTGQCGQQKSSELTVNIKLRDILVQKWDDVILVDNSSNNYIGYQWYLNGGRIEGAIKQFYQEKGGLEGNYSVELRLKDGTTEYSCDTAIVKIKRNTTIKIYPVPAPVNSSIEVHFDSGLSTIEDYIYFELYDLLGQLVDQGRLKETRFSISTDKLNAGTYLLRLMYNGKTYNEKIIIK